MMNYLDNEMKIIEQKKLEKVIKGLKCCAAMSGDKCRECPYSKECLDTDLPYGMPHLAADALALLKEQEPVEPTLDIRHGKSMWRCGSCSTALQPNQMHAKFCFNCGKAVKWE